MLISLTTFILLSFAAYRLTRFVIHDTLCGLGIDSGTVISAKIDKFGYNEDGSNRTFLRGKLADLLTCHYCISFWIASALLALWTWSFPWTTDSPQSWIITAFAIAGVVSAFYEFVDRESTTNVYNTR